MADLSMSAAAFQTLYYQLRDATPWGRQDRRGALNNLTPARVAAAASEVRAGRTVSLAAPVEHQASADNPDPWVHKLTVPSPGPDADGLDFALDSLSLHVHGNADSHIDALCHVVYDGGFYNDVLVGNWSPDGIGALAIDAAGQGIAGRGVMLDIPRLRGCDWIEPGDHVTAADLLAAETSQHVRIGAGDLLFVRVGHRRRRTVLGPWDAA